MQPTTIIKIELFNVNSEVAEVFIEYRRGRGHDADDVWFEIPQPGEQNRRYKKDDDIIIARFSDIYYFIPADIVLYRILSCYTYEI